MGYIPESSTESLTVFLSGGHLNRTMGSTHERALPPVTVACQPAGEPDSDASVSVTIVVQTMSPMQFTVVLPISINR